MLRPLFKQQYGRTSRIDKELELALRWWREVLANGVKETKLWRGPAEQPVKIYADARSTPPRIAAVLVSNGRCDECRHLYTFFGVVYLCIVVG